MGGVNGSDLATLRVLIDEDGDLWCELATDRWWCMPGGFNPSTVTPDQVWDPGRTRADVESQHVVREVILTSPAPKIDGPTWRSFFYAAFADGALIRRGTGLLNWWRRPDAPETDRMARVAAMVVEDALSQDGDA